MIPLEFALGLASGLVAAAVLYGLLWWWARRAASVGPPPGGAAGFPDPPPGAAPEEERLAENPDANPAVSPPAPGVTPMLPSDPPPPAPIVASVDRIGRGTHEATGTPGPIAPAETIRLSQRVILHVYAQGHLPAGAVAPPGLCQAGIGDALGLSQGGLAAVLRRLEAAGILTTERGHVQGHDRRLKIYRLSGRGLEIARELRARGGRRGGGRTPGP